MGERITNCKECKYCQKLQKDGAYVERKRILKLIRKWEQEIMHLHYSLSRDGALNGLFELEKRIKSKVGRKV